LLIPDGEGGGMAFCNGFLKKREKLNKYGKVQQKLYKRFRAKNIAKL
jgi:hypothetical protein